MLDWRRSEVNSPPSRTRVRPRTIAFFTVGGLVLLWGIAFFADALVHGTWSLGHPWIGLFAGGSSATAFLFGEPTEGRRGHRIARVIALCCGFIGAVVLLAYALFVTWQMRAI